MNIKIHRQNTYTFEKQNFYYFLAGLIDGNGHFSKIPQLVIIFKEKDAHVAYFLKKQIQYGIVSKVKNKKAFKFVISHQKGLQIVCNNIHNKLIHNDKIIQYNNRLCSIEAFKQTEQKSLIISNNSWFTGFFMSEGCFQIKVISSVLRKLHEILFVIQIDQKKKDLLLMIQKHFGGSIGLREKQNTFYYSSVNFKNAEKVIKYFDAFPLMGVKMTQYVLWRKVYVKIQEKFHLTPLGIKWIINVKKRMSDLGK